MIESTSVIKEELEIIHWNQALYALLFAVVNSVQDGANLKAQIAVSGAIQAFSELPDVREG